MRGFAIIILGCALASLSTGCILQKADPDEGGQDHMRMDPIGDWERKREREREDEARLDEARRELERERPACKRGDQDACAVVGWNLYLLGRDEVGMQLMLRACHQGSARGCRSAAERLSEPEASATRARACRLDKDWEPCVAELRERLEKGTISADEPIDRISAALAGEACLSAQAPAGACQLHLDIVLRDGGDWDAALAFTRRGCREPGRCAALASMLGRRRPAEAIALLAEACKRDGAACAAGSALTSRVQALEACARGELEPCREASVALERRELELARPRALAVHTRVCRAGDADACVRAAVLVLPTPRWGKPKPPDRDFVLAAQLYLEACRLRPGRICLSGGREVYGERKLESQELFERGCLGGVWDSCKEAGMLDCVDPGDTPACRASAVRARAGRRFPPGPAPGLPPAP